MREVGCLDGSQRKLDLPSRRAGDFLHRPLPISAVLKRPYKATYRRKEHTKAQVSFQYPIYSLSEESRGRSRIPKQQLGRPRSTFSSCPDTGTSLQVPLGADKDFFVALPGLLGTIDCVEAHRLTSR